MGQLTHATPRHARHGHRCNEEGQRQGLSDVWQADNMAVHGQLSWLCVFRLVPCAVCDWVPRAMATSCACLCMAQWQGHAKLKCNKSVNEFVQCLGGPCTAPHNRAKLMKCSEPNQTEPRKQPLHSTKGLKGCKQGLKLLLTPRRALLTWPESGVDISMCRHFWHCWLIPIAPPPPLPLPLPTLRKKSSCQHCPSCRLLRDNTDNPFQTPPPPPPRAAVPLAAQKVNEGQTRLRDVA